MADQSSDQHIQGYCGLCIARCGTVAVVQDGRFTRLEPDPTHPTGQALCAKGRAAPELVYHPERLTHPLRRTRPKGDGDPGWVRIGWDEALELTASAMRRIAQQHGPEAVSFSVSSPSTTAIADSMPFIRRLMNAFGTPNVLSNLDICGWGRAGATRYTYGVASIATSGGGAMPDIANSGCLILWGYNPSYSRLTHATAVADALKRGMKLIVVDPRHVGSRQQGRCLAAGPAWNRRRARTRHRQPDDPTRLVRSRLHPHLEQRADAGARRHRSDADRGRSQRGLGHSGPVARCLYGGRLHEPRPGGRVPRRHATMVCHPAFELYAQLCRRYPPEQVESICWIPRDQVEDAARLIWHARPVSYYAYSGHEHHANTTQTARAMSLLYALTGSFDAPGGNVLLPAPPAASITGDDLPAAKRMAPTLGLAERPLGHGALRQCHHARTVSGDPGGATISDPRPDRLRLEHAAGAPR